VALLVPDKHVVRTATAAMGIGIFALSGGRMSINSILPLMTVALYGWVLWHLRARRGPRLTRHTTPALQ
jgi:hypothetical protein